MTPEKWRIFQAEFDRIREENQRPILPKLLEDLRLWVVVLKEKEAFGKWKTKSTHS
jgi:hypothetical protein